MRTTALTLCLILSGCGHFLTPLGDVQPQTGKSQAEQDFARSECVGQSRASVENPATMAVSTGAGLTIVGAPMTVAALQAKRKSVFKDCMAERGYAVLQGS